MAPAKESTSNRCFKHCHFPPEDEDLLIVHAVYTLGKALVANGRMPLNGTSIADGA